MKKSKFKIGKNSVQVGQSYYEAHFIAEDYYEHSKPHIVINEYVLRSVRKKYVYSIPSGTPCFVGRYAHFTLKARGLTWVPKKHLDWGFAKYIPRWCKRRYKVSKSSNFHLSPTIVGAITKEISHVRNCQFYSPAEKELAIKKLNQKLKSERKKSVNPT